MVVGGCVRAGAGVALRKESVDRNVPAHVAVVPLKQVALRKESVDRNQKKSIAQKAFDAGRSPQGERG